MKRFNENILPWEGSLAADSSLDQAGGTGS